jgi:hypothetical protein
MEDINKRRINWRSILIRILDELPIDKKVVYNKVEYSFCYVAFPHNRIGYLIIWESGTKRGIKISRVGVPVNFSFVDINNDAEIESQIPQDILLEEMDV